MILLIKLLLAHFLGDFLLQPKSWVKAKEQDKLRSPQFYWHIALHGLLVIILLWDWHYWSLVLWVICIHGVIDALKLYLQKERQKPIGFLVDQSFHLISLFVLWLCWSQSDVPLEEYLQNPNLWIWLTAILLITAVANVVLKILLEKWSEELEEENTESLKNAGKYIGILERLFVFTFIVTGNWEAIGFLLAAKSVFRFGDLRESKDRKLTEYILIGTLISFGIATAIGLLVVNIIGLG